MRLAFGWSCCNYFTVHDWLCGMTHWFILKSNMVLKEGNVTGWSLVTLLICLITGITGHIAYHVVCIFSASEWRWELPF